MVIWNRRKKESCKTIQKGCVKSARDITHVLSLIEKAGKKSPGRECFGAEYWEERVLNHRGIISNCYFSHVQKSKASHSVTCGIEITQVE